ncbi:hypothetical protein D9619_008398 [Psilocybe cf. subviscida]|uniref:DNA mismatch repair protein PMS1 n=1 Tax=Psilocybe cf. subviscida TaxID=2480587 RepID=A0A8H5F0T2_9AGAR|nr:hypothetical protein D9619_008398 [Psilocybe cf. subviscida]
MPIKAIDASSVHKITSGQVIVDLQTAVKELLENGLDAGATNVEVRFKNYGLATIEVVDNGSGIQEGDHESIGLKHHTSKLEIFTDLEEVRTFGFRGEALSSLCALCEEVVITTATAETAPMGVIITLASSGKVEKKGTVARNQGTTITLKNLFKPLPVRRKELERNIKREFGRVLTLLHAYALGPCAAPPGIRLTVSNQPEKGAKAIPIKTIGTPSGRTSVTALWGSKALDNVLDMDLSFQVAREKATLKILQNTAREPITVQVKGLVSKFAVGCGRAANDRQFFFVNGRPCNIPKVQKAFNEVYRSFNATQSPFIVADFVIPTESYDVNVSPDKRTILLHSEGNLVSALKEALESHFAPARATFDLGGTQVKMQTQTLLTEVHISASKSASARGKAPMRIPEDDEGDEGDSKDEDRLALQNKTPNSRSLSVIGASTEVPTLVVGLEDEMEVDNNENGPDGAANADNDVEAEIQVDTSQTTWGRQLGMNSRKPSPSDAVPSPDPVVRTSFTSPPPQDLPLFLPSPPSPPPPDLISHSAPAPPSVSSPTSVVSDRILLRQQQAAARAADAETSRAALKKRKSESGTAIVTAVAAYRQPSRDYDEDSDDEQPRPNGRDNRVDDDDNDMAPPQKKVSSIVSVSENGTPGEKLRGRLANFASGGSQIGSQILLANDPVTITEENEAKDAVEVQDDDDLEDEVDELEDSDTLVEPPRKFRQGAVASSSRSKPSTIPRSRKSADEYASAIDLTSDDEVELEASRGHDDDNEDIEDSSQHAEEDNSTLGTTPSSQAPVHHPEVLRVASTDGDISLRFDLQRVRETWSKKARVASQPTPAQPEEDAVTEILADASISNVNDEQRAVNALARVIEKTDFASMDIVGQFNLGFIIVRRRKTEELAEGGPSTSPTLLDDLFIVDQHAADEKYNFETLQATTKIASQKLFRPRPLELTAPDEMVAIENLDILQKNGFEVTLEDEQESEDSQGSRLKLTATPISKNTVFDMKDLEELIHLIRDRPSGQLPRCSKARAMFAMRACRKSVMVGMPLNQHQMTSVVRHMGTMDQPWNCPHGRPTMRHLLDIKHSGSKSKQNIDWKSFERLDS